MLAAAGGAGLAVVHLPVRFAPQYFGSVNGLMHLPWQSTYPVWQESVHAPFAHTLPGMHVTPVSPLLQFAEAPQNVKSVSGSMHLPWQLMSPAWHVSWHWPPAQTSPLGHWLPALTPWQLPVAPQYCVLDVGSVQAPPHTICPVMHELPQVPFEQIDPSVHAVPAEPLPPAAQAPVAPQC
jgi:hypothetical protein